MSDTTRPGFYQDHEGNWCPDRRKNRDRRSRQVTQDIEDRRGQRRGRRKTDQVTLERDHRAMIDEALADFEAGNSDGDE